VAAAVAVATLIVAIVVIVSVVVCRFSVTVLGKRAGRITGKNTGYYRIDTRLIVEALDFTRLS